MNLLLSWIITLHRAYFTEPEYTIGARLLLYAKEKKIIINKRGHLPTALYTEMKRSVKHKNGRLIT